MQLPAWCFAKQLQCRQKKKQSPQRPKKPDWKRWTRLAKAGNLSVADWQVLDRMGFSASKAHLELLPVMADSECGPTHGSRQTPSSR